MDGGAVFALLFVVVALAFPVALWMVVERETDQTQVMDREAAERASRWDTGHDGWARDSRAPQRDDNSRDDVGWDREDGRSSDVGWDR